MATVKLGPSVLDLSGIRAGDMNQITFTLNRDGTPVNLTDYLIAAEVRKTAIDTVVAITAECQVLDPLLGTFYVAFNGEDVRTALAGGATYDGVWDLEIASSAGDTITIAAGKFQAVSDVTRPVGR